MVSSEEHAADDDESMPLPRSPSGRPSSALPAQGTAFNIRTTASQQCGAVPRGGSYVMLIDCCFTQLKARE
jgi:hypothetical protein